MIRLQRSNSPAKIRFQQACAPRPSSAVVLSRSARSAHHAKREKQVVFYLLFRNTVLWMPSCSRKHWATFLRSAGWAIFSIVVGVLLIRMKTCGGFWSSMKKGTGHWLANGLGEPACKRSLQTDYTVCPIPEERSCAFTCGILPTVLVGSDFPCH